MVRLRSDRWYSADGQGRSRATVGTRVSGSRRVLSLCFLLALVIVLMQKAADPKHVRNAFQALGVPLDKPVVLEPGSRSAGLADASSTSAEQQRGSDNPKLEDFVLAPSRQGDRGTSLAGSAIEPPRWQSTCRDLVPRLLNEANPAEIEALGLRWFAGVELEPLAIPNPLTNLLQQAANQLADLQAELVTEKDVAPTTQESTDDEWALHVERFVQQWQALENRVLRGQLQTTFSPVFVEALDQFLDERLLDALSDAAPWKKGESLTFWRLLQRGRGRGATLAMEANEDSPLINTLQLEGELSVYRGKWIRYRGTVRRADLIERGNDLLGIKSYWSLWLRGEDGSPQPVTVYTTHAIGQQLALAIADEQFPHVEVLGIVGKRLAYAASGGVEVAPTLFATSILQFADAPPAIIARSAQEIRQDVGWSLLVGLLISACVLVPILSNWRRKKMSRKVTRKSSNTGLMMCVAVALGPANVAFSQTEISTALPQPPWAEKQSDSALQSLLVDRLQTALTENASAELRSFLQEPQGEFPNAALKTLYALRQVGWASVLPEDTYIPFPVVGLDVKLQELRGWVRLAMPVRLDEQQQLWFHQDENQMLYRLEVDTALEPQAASTNGRSRELVTVFCTEIPSQWLDSAQLLQPVVLRGLSLLDRTASDLASDNTQATLCMFTKAPIWKLPESSESSEWLSLLQPPWNPRWQLLDRLGWELNNLDLVGQRNQQPIRADEAEAFFSLVKGASHGQQTELESLTLLQVLEDPKSLVGAPVQWPVRLVSGSMVKVSQSQYQEWLGADHYFQFDGFVDMGSQTIQYKIPAATGDRTIKFQGEFPVTIVMRDGSAFVPQEKLQAGELSWSVGEYVSVTGLFYRLWSYESELMNINGADARQAAPLIMARELTFGRAPARRSTASIGWFGYALAAATLSVLAGIMWSVFHQPLIRPRGRRNTGGK